MRFTFLLAALALAAGCASTPSAPPSMTSAVDTSDPSFTPNGDGFVMVETRTEEAPRKGAAPLALPAPNHEQARGHVHAATN